MAFSTAAFRFGHSLVRQTFSHSASQQTDLEEMFEAFKTTHKYGRLWVWELSVICIAVVSKELFYKQL